MDYLYVFYTNDFKELSKIQTNQIIPYAYAYELKGNVFYKSNYSLQQFINTNINYKICLTGDQVEIINKFLQIGFVNITYKKYVINNNKINNQSFNFTHTLVISFISMFIISAILRK